MNTESSRSHSVFTLKIRSRWQEKGIWNVRRARLHIIDLAGSERQSTAGTTGVRLREAANINKYVFILYSFIFLRSLSTLGRVINALVDKNKGLQRFVHYRDSKLTFLLRDSIGGNSKVCF